ncbi:uncharacterized protein BCR38DRAFT_489514 [Pseudomassariella vexata]|uniref:DUF7702 domain-containing protein n=1 Tax=Pseudomassariella vexata TaxID=1141098 RepID=A0A1Y2DFQ4_9PEZI|nr:uncharacterized protein BCR38DRAFT_489514 [Pseudomassariella vexata]ORY58027.1 hypothetical protein BCR38DRAFT_489514 [Pseudomassariella vexata]
MARILRALIYTVALVILNQKSQNSCGRDLFDDGDGDDTFEYLAGGVAIVAAGASSLASPHPKSNALKLAQVGIAILTVSWLFLSGWAFASLLPSQRERNTVTYDTGTTLLRSVLAALFFLGIRVIYSLIAMATQSPTLNPVTGNLAVQVVLSFVPELLCVLGFIVAGILTQNIRRLRNAQGAEKRCETSRSEYL